MVIVDVVLVAPLMPMPLDVPQAETCEQILEYHPRGIKETPARDDVQKDLLLVHLVHVDLLLEHLLQI